MEKADLGDGLYLDDQVGLEDPYGSLPTHIIPRFDDSMTRRIFPEALHQKKGFKETKQGWLNMMKAGINCPFSQSKFTAEGICASTTS